MTTENWDECHTLEQAAAWEKLAGTWESEACVEAEIEAMYAARTAGSETHL